ncbi:RcnB family protein [Sphingomonas sp.]|uniref:RcnB family protein n=1 Tax=Sphingomonas sp. TaxID=28214 RepID=UPI0035BBEEF3
MRFLFKALLAATALVPLATAASAQQADGRQWRGGGDRGGDERSGERSGGERRGGGERPDVRQAPAEAPRIHTDRDLSQRGDWSARRQTLPSVSGTDPGRRTDAPGRIDSDRRPNDGTFRRDPGVAFGAAGDPGAIQRPGGIGRRDERPAPGLRGDRGDPGERAGFGTGRADAGTYRQRDQNWTRDRDNTGQWRGDENRAANRGAWNRGTWNRDWRNDRRYDYGGYRDQNRGAYRLPRYYAPYGSGYGYRRFSVGVTLSSVLFGENYWIDDPYDYRLPAAYGPYRWVRYYNDALLVDVRYGRVVDTVYDIFR